MKEHAILMIQVDILVLVRADFQALVVKLQVGNYIKGRKYDSVFRMVAFVACDGVKDRIKEPPLFFLKPGSSFSYITRL